MRGGKGNKCVRKNIKGSTSCTTWLPVGPQQRNDCNSAARANLKLKVMTKTFLTSLYIKIQLFTHLDMKDSGSYENLNPFLGQS